MYRLLVYLLGGLAGIGFIFSLTGRISYDPLDLALSFTVLLTACFVANMVLARVWAIPTNTDSGLITSLILFLILAPSSQVTDLVMLFVGGFAAIGSKFIITWSGRHIFNPAAFGAAFLSLSTLLPAIWWVGSSALIPFVAVAGLIIVRKVRHAGLAAAFICTVLVVQSFDAVINGHELLPGIQSALISSPLIFFATIMLTEPLTMPTMKKHQYSFAVLVGLLYATGLKLGPIYIYPEVALLIGNAFAFVMVRQGRPQFRLEKIERISDRIYDFVLSAQHKPNYLSGQYMEVTLPGMAVLKTDSRGNRRTFTLASAPSEATIRLGVKFYEPSSAFKKHLRSLQPGSIIYGSPPMGSFILPANPNQKLLFIAGGIGVTPFRSMIKYLTDTSQQRDVVLIYLVNDESEAAYKGVFTAAEAVGVKTFVRTRGQNVLTGDGMQQFVPDYRERTVFISGPNSMVQATKKLLTSSGVARRNIKTDYFSGY